MTNSQTTWTGYWDTRPIGVKSAVTAFVAALLAIYTVIGLLAIVGIWRNNLLQPTSNWPWAFPLAILALLGQKFNRLIFIHGIIFVPLTVLLIAVIPFFGYLGHFELVWYAPTSVAAIGILNVVYFRKLTGRLKTPRS